MGAAVPTVDLKKLTAIVRTFDRPQAVRRLVKSVRKFYPQLRLLVADDSHEPQKLQGIDVLRLPADSGLGACQNALLARVRTPYFLLLNDIAELHRGTEIEELLQLVIDDKLDIAGGDVTRCNKRLVLFTQRRPSPQHGLCEFAGSSLKIRPGTRTRGEGYAWCDIVGNFFVARTSKVRNLGGWDAELHDDQREEFFVRAHRQGLRVGLAPDVNVWQWPEKANTGDQLGQGNRMSLAVAKMGLERLTDLDGNVAKAPRRARAA